MKELAGLLRAIGQALWPDAKYPLGRVLGLCGLILAIAFVAGTRLYGPPKTIVKHEQGPVHTVYATPQPHPPIKVIEVEQPQSCKDAISLAAKLSANAVTMSDSSGPLIDAMKEAGVAMQSGDKNKMNAATEKVSKLNSDTLKAKQDYAIIYPQFTAKWHQCEKESK